MAQQFSITDQKRITFLSLLSSAATAGATPGVIDQDAVYHTAQDWLARMEEDGFFAAAPNPTPRRSERSARPASNSRPSNSGRGRDQRGGGGFNGNMRDPDGPPTEKQVGLLLRLTDDYTSDEVWEMTKAEVSALIEDLKN